MVGNALDYPNGTRKFYNPNIEIISIGNSMTGSTFKPYKVVSVNSEIGILNSELP